MCLFRGELAGVTSVLYCWRARTCKFSIYLQYLKYYLAQKFFEFYHDLSLRIRITARTCSVMRRREKEKERESVKLEEKVWFEWSTLARVCLTNEHVITCLNHANEYIVKVKERERDRKKRERRMRFVRIYDVHMLSCQLMNWKVRPDFLMSAIRCRNYRHSINMEQRNCLWLVHFYICPYLFYKAST